MLEEAGGGHGSDEEVHPGTRRGDVHGKEDEDVAEEKKKPQW